VESLEARVSLQPGSGVGRGRICRTVRCSASPVAPIKLLVTMSAFSQTLRAAQAGDEQAIAALWRSMNAALLRFLRGRDPNAAEDVASETWIRAARNLSHFRGDEAAFRAWMFTIARRSLIDHHRRAARRPETLTAAPPSDVGSLEASAESEALTAFATSDALAVIRRLTPDQADVILLRVLAGLNTRQVASVLGHSESSVRVLQHRALRRLAELMAPTHVSARGVTR
jgi:RNA polymerase sigma-70 factor, ECF subfamily